MIQGGDPTGTGTGGKSIWSKKFEDDIKPNLSHTGRGILSMANSGPNTNDSQFFITYRSCRHLDGKHTVFGKLVGGLDTLNEMEKIEVDNKDRPIEDIIIEKTTVFSDPFQEAEEELAKERNDEVEAKRKQDEEKKREQKRKGPLKAYREGVGKYLNFTEINSATNTSDPVDMSTVAQYEPLHKKTKQAKTYFNDFSSW